MQAKYGTKFLKDLSIPTVKHQKLELVQLPFNQFKYDKDFKSSLDDFHLNKSSVDQPKTLELEQLKSPIGSYLKSYQMIIPLQFKDPILLFKQVKPIFEETLKNNLHSLRSLKYSVGLESIFVKDSLDSSSLPTFTDPPVRFYTEQKAILNEDDIDLSKEFSKLVVRIEDFVQNGSGWKLNTLKTLWLDIAKYEPIKGSSYLPLPDALKNKQAVVNIKNNDEHCLRYCLRAALFPAKNNINKVSSYPTEDGLNFEGIISPTPVSQITKVETLNNLAINVYGWENNKVIIHRISNQPHNVKRINTLIVEQDGKTHYVWVKHFNRLLGSKHEKQMFYCERCLIGCTRNDLLEDHLIDCRGINERAVRIQMPTPNNKNIKFVNHKNQLKAPWVIYADFESIIRPIEGPIPSPKKSFTHLKSIHESCGFSLRVVRSDGFSPGLVFYRGPDCIQEFLKQLKEAEPFFKQSLKNRKKRYNLTSEEYQRYYNSDTSWICGEQGFDNSNKKICLSQEAYCLKCAIDLTDDYEVCSERVKDFKEFRKQTKCKRCNKTFMKKDKVIDHDHITGKYRGAAHSSCNTKLRIDPEKVKIPVFFHNLRGYDAHLIMQYIGEQDGTLSCIPNNKEKYISFSWRQFVFKDSVQFLLASLDELVKANPEESFKLTKKDYSQDEFNLLFRKGVYPYEYMDSWERFDETALPPIEKFYSSLTDSHISKEDYEHATKVWNTFKCKTLGDYHDLYLKTDVNLLADVFENFRNICLKQYKLDPANYYTSPGLSWDALLKKTNVILDLLTDYNMYLMVEKGLRGGISMVSNRYAKANNPLLEDFNPNEKTSYLMYLDANNLYGWAMVQHLPTDSFKWSSANIEDILKHPLEDQTGYICEVDLEYPDELHEKHNDYPLAPEKLEVQSEWLSEYQQSLEPTKSSLKVKKLVPNLMSKSKYVLHYRNLQLYISLGMTIKQVHRVLEFNQKSWMAPYIKMNTELRKAAKSDFEKDFFKLMNNSVFGKTMENLRKRINVQLVKGNNEMNKLRKLIAKPSFNTFKVFNDNLVAVHMYKDTLKLNRPIYVGMSILDLSKHLMYDFYYNQLKKQYPECSLLYTDTDSFILKIETADIYKDIKKNIDFYDTSNYKKDHFLFNKKNKKVLGKFKDECGGVPIKEYAGLRPKMYSVITQTEKIRKAKGVKKNVVKNQITHQNYLDCLFNCKTFKHSMDMLRSYNHQIYGIKVNKSSLSPLDTKRWIADDEINTLAYGHYTLL